MEDSTDPTSPRKADLIIGIVVGIGVGALVEIMAVFLAIFSDGIGHGDFVFARAAFPIPLLFMPFEGQMGAMTLSTGLLQFPFYGGFVVWSLMRRAYQRVALLVFLHLAAAVACFTGWLSQFV